MTERLDPTSPPAASPAPAAHGPPPDPAQELAQLLVEIDREPDELAAAIRERRESLMAGDAALARDLDRAELRFLVARARDPRAGAAVRQAVDAARRVSLGRDLRDLVARPDGGAAELFDLAELCAHHVADGAAGEAERARRELDRRVGSVTALTPALRQEARERYAALSTEEEDLPLPLTIALLREHHALFRELAARTGDRELRRLARRLHNAACDRTLAARMERALTRRGAGLLENASLLLLAVVFVLLGVELALPDGHPLIPTLLFVDAGICSFFIAEFAFKLALAPSRGSWFLRNALTDLLPAIPAALYFVHVSFPGDEVTVVARALRFLRITWFARYVQMLRPALRLFRLALFMVRGMDSLVARFSPLLNRDFVFFERRVLPLGPQSADGRGLLFRALRREHVLLSDLEPERANARLQERAERLRERAAGAATVVDNVREHAIDVRAVPVEHAIEFLYALRPDELAMWLPRQDVRALDRFVRVVNAPLIRSLPIFRWFRSPARLPSSEERVVDFGCRIAGLLERWRERVLYVADLHGIVTGPQILDRIASAMVRASQRPAVRLLLFGGLFAVVQLLVGEESVVGHFLERFVATPLVVLGLVCLVLLILGRWLKSLAGEAADTFKMTAEAHFLGLLELVKRRNQEGDLEFLSRRVFRWDMEHWGAAALLAAHLRAARTGEMPAGIAAPKGLEAELNRVALLYLHFLDGAVLHENDIKTTEQLLANLSLENIRNDHLRYSRKDRKRLRRLSLADGSLFRGPYVWFRFITESVAVETAKRVTDYNRHCLTLAQRRVASPRQRRAFAYWLRKRRQEDAGRIIERREPPHEVPVFQTTEFNALDFVSNDRQRREHIERVFGRHVYRMLERDRRQMIREIFGTRPLHELDRSRRTLNAYRFYQARLSGGRFVLAPLYLLLLLLRGFGMTVQKTRRIVGEILDPETAARAREVGVAPFEVALRKIHRMKGATLVEAMRLRVSFDPVYCGAPPGWSAGRPFATVAPVERDMDFLRMRERERQEMRELGIRNRRRVEELHALVRRLPPLGEDGDDGEDRRRGERAVTIAYLTDREDLRTLFRAEPWFEAALARMESRETRLPARRLRRLLGWLLRGGRPHPVARFLRERMGGRGISRRGRRNFVRAWCARECELRSTVRAWSALAPEETPGARALALARSIYRRRDDISRELAALRAVQSLSVLDVRNYRKLVFELGGYGADGEDAAQAEALP